MQILYFGQKNWEISDTRSFKQILYLIYCGFLSETMSLNRAFPFKSQHLLGSYISATQTFHFYFWFQVQKKLKNTNVPAYFTQGWPNPLETLCYRQCSIKKYLHPLSKFRELICTNWQNGWLQPGFSQGKIPQLDSQMWEVPENTGKNTAKIESCVDAETSQGLWVWKIKIFF